MIDYNNIDITFNNENNKIKFQKLIQSIKKIDEKLSNVLFNNVNVNLVTITFNDVIIARDNNNNIHYIDSDDIKWNNFKLLLKKKRNIEHNLISIVSNSD
tara:strand:+ start:310 stop:609 length:300 start_codon:yes stop_codon:yes gene_type:complete